MHGDHMKHVVKLAEEALNVVAGNAQTHLLLTVDGSVQMYLRSQDHAIRTSAQVGNFYGKCYKQLLLFLANTFCAGAVFCYA